MISSCVRAHKGVDLKRSPAKWTSTQQETQNISTDITICNLFIPKFPNGNDGQKIK